jgi:hypothetical protein
VSTGDADGAASGSVLVATGESLNGPGGNIGLAVGGGTDVTAGNVSVSAGNTSSVSGHGRGLIETKRSTAIESPLPPPRVCMSIHPKDKSCSISVRVRFLNDPSARRRRANTRRRIVQHGCDQHGRVAQVDPMKFTLNPPRSKRLKPKYDELLSNFALDFNLRRYSTGSGGNVFVQAGAALGGHRESSGGNITLLSGRGVVENNHSTDIESPPPSPRVCMRVDPEGDHAPISDRALVLNDPPVRLKYRCTPWRHQHSCELWVDVAVILNSGDCQFSFLTFLE